MAILGESTKTLHPWITEGSRREGTCTTRRKKTIRKQRMKWKTVREILVDVNSLLPEDKEPSVFDRLSSAIELGAKMGIPGCVILPPIDSKGNWIGKPIGRFF